MRLWDWALCYGVKGTKVCQKLLRLVARPVFGDRLCLQCSREIDPAVPFFDHFLSQCSNQSMPNMDKLLQTLGTELIFDFDWLR